MKLIALIFIVGFQFLVSFGQDPGHVSMDSVFIYSDTPSDSKLMFIENCENGKEKSGKMYMGLRNGKGRNVG